MFEDDDSNQSTPTSDVGSKPSNDLITWLILVGALLVAWIAEKWGILFSNEKNNPAHTSTVITAASSANSSHPSSRKHESGVPISTTQPHNSIDRHFVADAEDIRTREKITSKLNSLILSQTDFKRDSVAPPVGKLNKLKVFLCHASEDKQEIRLLYSDLTEEGFDVWMAEKRLVSGQDWDLEIKKAVRASHVVVVCLSQKIKKRGYVHTELSYVLNTALEIPFGRIFIIPLRLEECEVPIELQKYHYVDYFDLRGYKRLIDALRKAADENIE